MQQVTGGLKSASKACLVQCDWDIFAKETKVYFYVQYCHNNSKNYEPVETAVREKFGFDVTVTLHKIHTSEHGSVCLFWDSTINSEINSQSIRFWDFKKAWLLEGLVD